MNKKLVFRSLVASMLIVFFGLTSFSQTSNEAEVQTSSLKSADDVNLPNLLTNNKEKEIKNINLCINKNSNLASVKTTQEDLRFNKMTALNAIKKSLCFNKKYKIATQNNPDGIGPMELLVYILIAILILALLSILGIDLIGLLIAALLVILILFLLKRL